MGALVLPDLLVSTEWLAERLDHPDLVVLDCTVWLRITDSGAYQAVSGRTDHETAHLPGAGFADLTGSLCDGSSTLRFALPTPQRFAAAMAELGVGDDSAVVLYDQNRSMWAARVWWMLRWVGFDRAALLDGGLQAWQAEGRPVTSGPVTRPPSELTARPRPRLVADRDEVLRSIGDGGTCLIDALPEAQYSGTSTTYPRPGHIPGAVNAPAANLVDQVTGRYLPLSDLASRFPSDRRGRVIAYCGGGIAASSDAFVLTRLGFEDVAVYTASLQEWAADPSNPLEL